MLGETYSINGLQIVKMLPRIRWKDHLKVMPGLSVFVAGTRWEAALWGRYLNHQNDLEYAAWNPFFGNFQVDRANGASWGLSLLYHTL